MEKQTKELKLNMPCWICDEDLIIGQAITTFGDNSHKSPAHLSCVKAQAISEFKEKLKEEGYRLIYQELVNSKIITSRSIKEPIGSVVDRIIKIIDKTAQEIREQSETKHKLHQK